MKPFARRFYSSKAWQRTRAAYAKSKGNLCELCLAKGLFNPCEIVHHKVELTPDNIDAVLAEMGIEGADLSVMGAGFTSEKAFSSDWSDYFDGDGSTFNKVRTI